MQVTKPKGHHGLTAVLLSLALGVGMVVGLTPTPSKADPVVTGGLATTILGTVNYNRATYDTALPQLEALVDQSGTNRQDLRGIMDGMYYYIRPSSEGDNIPNQLELARVIENRIIAKFADRSKYNGTATDTIWTNPEDTSILWFVMTPVDAGTFFIDVGEGLQLLSVSETSPNYLLGDEDLGLGRCMWTTGACTKTVPVTAQTISVIASARPDNAQVGETLVPHPTFSTPPWRVLYKWVRDTDTARTIVQASTTKADYTVQPEDLNARLSCYVYLSLAGYAMDLQGNGVGQGAWIEIPVVEGGGTTPPPVMKVFSKTYSPKIVGTAKVGYTLTASSRTKKWSPRPTSVKYQWNSDGTPIGGATGSKYKVAPADIGHAITVTVTGSKAGYTTTAKTSKSTKLVVPGTIHRGTAKITGTRRVGKTLTATTRHWTSGVTYNYQWERWTKDTLTDTWSWVPIEGATDRSYLLSPVDLGIQFNVAVTATKDGYTSVTKTSHRTAKVKTGYLTKATPLIGGTTEVGQTLTVNPGAWKPAETTLAYQWYEGKKVRKHHHWVMKWYRVIGATEASLVIPDNLAGRQLRVKVTGSADGYNTTSQYSKYTAKVKDKPVPPTDPTPPVNPSPSPSPSPSPTR